MEAVKTLTRMVGLSKVTAESYASQMTAGEIAQLKEACEKSDGSRAREVYNAFRARVSTEQKAEVEEPEGSEID